MAKISRDEAFNQILSSFNIDFPSSSAFLVTGAPRSGKSELARDVTVQAAIRFGSENVALVVTNRVIADETNREILRQMGVLGQRRLATTLSAIAFRIIETRQLLNNAEQPKLINGAEQTAALRTICDRHLDHARSGDLCDTCMLLRQYFEGVAQGDSQINVTTQSLFETSITPVFLQQLRDMFARINELGASHTKEDMILRAVKEDGDNNPAHHFEREYTVLQFKLAYALRREYAQEVRRQSSGQLSLDSSRLLREAALTFADGTASKLKIPVPRVVVVDDAQELTLAGVFLLKELYKAGTRIVLIGNPDESVLGFRGAFADFIWNRAAQTSHQGEEDALLESDFACFHAARIDMKSAYDVDTMHYKDVIAARVALSIPSEYDTDVPLPQRAQKFPDFTGSPSDTTTLNTVTTAWNNAGRDGSLEGHLFHSSREETTHLIRGVLGERMNHNRSWNDMAIIVHDNSAARALGIRLRDEGVPVRFSAVTKPLSEDLVTRGLFASIELGLAQLDDYDSCDTLCAHVDALLRQFVNSPFARDDNGSLVGIRHIDSALNAIAAVFHAWKSAQNTRSAKNDQPEQPEQQEAQKEQESYDTQATQQKVAQDHDSGFQIIDEAWNRVCAHYQVTDDVYPVNVSALKVLLLLGAKTGNKKINAEADVSDEILHLMAVMRSEYKNDITALKKLTSMSTACASVKADGANVIATLWAAWDASDVSRVWQSKALDFSNFAQRLRYNEWLDNAMRLFDYANQKNAHMSIGDFISHVINLEISADSLAHLAPVEEAVTVTTPASAVGQTWPIVWMPGVQQGVWPHVLVRNTMFGADSLTDIMLHGKPEYDVHMRLLDVLHSEKKSFLVSLTRATQTLHMSAVWNEESSPSDFLYEYASEIFPREDTMNKADFTAVPVVQLSNSSLEDELGVGQFTSINDVIRQARVTLAEEKITGTSELSERGRDALSALDYLRTLGYECANPEKWAFVGREHEQLDEETDSQDYREVRLSPSSVENIWGCPICYRLENKFSGPQQNTAATSFGTLIHAVAQWASEDMGFDSSTFYEEQMANKHDPQVVVDYVTERMKERYDEVKPALDIDAQSSELARQLRNDHAATDILRNIAHYFVMSHNPELAHDDGRHPPYKELTDSQVEQEFDAYFTLEDIRFAYNSIPERVAMNQADFEKLIRMFAGGMPQGYSYDTVVHLHGSIDRVEKHGDATYIVDFKTGNAQHSLTAQTNDLQLVSYQLGLTFPPHEITTDAERKSVLARAPRIDMSVLFDVRHENVPATSNKEGFARYQPGLFDNGHISTGDARRKGSKTHTSVWGEVLTFDEEIINQMSQSAQSRLESEKMNKESDRTLYVLSLISRIFYAAACMRSETIDVSEIHAPHKREFCAYRDVCPICAGGNNSVMEEWL